MNKFTVGALAGMSSLLLAVPLIAQVAGAQTVPSSAADRPVPTQACLQAMVGMEDVQLSHFDERTAEHKTAMQTKRDALAAVAAISDETARKAALQQMHEDMRASKDTEKTVPADVTAAMEAVRTACGEMFGGKKGHGKFMMKGPVDSTGSPRMGGMRRGTMKFGGTFNKPVAEPTTSNQ